MKQLPAFRRPLAFELTGLLAEEGSMRFVAVTGLRQTGETILVRQEFGELERGGSMCRYIAVDNPSSDASFPGHCADSGVLIPGCLREVEWILAM